MRNFLIKSREPSLDANTITDARSYYEHHRDRLIAEGEALERSTTFLARARGITFLVFLFLLICGWSQAAPRSVCFVAAGITFVGFVLLVSRYDQLVAKRQLIRLREQFHREQLARLDRDWSALPTDRLSAHPRLGGLAHDLDLFGAASVYQLVNETNTPRGKELLSDWLAEPAEPEEFVRRQPAVRWLATQPERREAIALAGRALEASQARPDALLEWGQGPGWLSARPHVVWGARAIAMAIVGLSALVLLQLVPAVLALAVYLLVVVSLLFNALWLGSVHEVFNQVTVGRYEIEHYRVLFQAVWDLPSDIEMFAHMRAALGEGADDFEHALRRLRWLVALSSGRRAGALSALYILGQLLVMWDFHVLTALERWQRRYGPHLAQWFEAVGQLEALCSFGAVSFNHPNWCFPKLETSDADILVAEGLGHPLLPPATCVRNNVSLKRPGTFLLVTGSNMSGKSTLLRAIGVNTVLAQAGSVVCANVMQIVPMQLATSMRIEDSLAEGVSHFMAELRRLKQIVEEARCCHERGRRQFLFLLDEILQGTNSRERHLAVERIVGHLIEMQAAGAVSTHDLELASSHALQDVVQTVHFRESFESGTDAAQMVFDYRLRDGVCPTTNAMKLMALMGLA